MPASLLQKPSKMLNGRDHLEALERKLQLWERGEIKSLLLEAEIIQQRSTSKLMRKGNINGTLNLLTNNMTNGILSVDEKTFISLKQRHPQSQPAYEEILITGEPTVIHPVIFGYRNEELVKKAAIRTKGGSSLSRLNADEWRKMLTSKVFCSCTSDLRKAIADFIKHICVNEIKFQNNTTSLETYIASRLVPLDKNPGLRPIGVEEVLCRIAGIVVMTIVKEDVTKTVGNLQLYGGQDAGCEAAVHLLHGMTYLQQTRQKQFYLLMLETHSVP